MAIDDEPLIEEKKSQIISFTNSKPTHRIAHFLNPISNSSSNQSKPLFKPPSSKPISPIFETLKSKVVFNGWRNPLKEWNSWVEKMSAKYESIWRKSHIYEAIIASKHGVPKCREVVFGLGVNWCPETSTFVFPWGEVTITLEDVMVLGGFSVTGDSVLSEISGVELVGISKKKLLEIEEELLVVRSKMVRTKAKKASQQQWMDIWMENKQEFEHEAFLCLWLSRYVLPADDNCTMNKSVFLIAVLLANGVKIALAPAVLASIYRDLRLLKEKIDGVGGFKDENEAKLVLWAPLYLLQVWFWERFPGLSPNPSPVSGNVCRLVRWSKVKVVTKEDVVLDLDSAKADFQWRPYSKLLKNWLFDSDLESYVRCIRGSKLVGLDCVEEYFPHRVTMQFGLDQDIPIACPRSRLTNENAWSSYNRPIGDVKKLYVPPKDFEAGVTARYLDWWSQAVKGSLSFEVKKGCDLNISMEMGERMRVKIENNEAEVPPGFTPIGKWGSEKNVAEVPPGFIPNGKRVSEQTDDSSYDHKPSTKKPKRSSDFSYIDIGSSDSNASHGNTSRNKEMKTEYDSDDDDHRTLSQLFAVKDAGQPNDDDHRRLTRRETPSSSAGDNTSFQEIKYAANNSSDALPSAKCSRKESNIEDGTESKAASPVTPVRSSISIDKNDFHAISDDAHESSNIDLLDRIARLQRIIDVLKAAKITQT